MSVDGTLPCAGCHRPEKSFTDAPHQVSAGVDGQQGTRNAPIIVNAGYRKAMFWDGRAATLEEQAMAAFMNPTEMAADTFAVANLLRSAEYAADWKAAFGDTTVTMHRAMQAIATFERTLVASNSRYDHFKRGDTSALSAQERQGLQLFFSDRTMCASCHSGPDFTDELYHNIGLFHHYFDRGRFQVTHDPKDEGLFKTPTLRNVALTPPYMSSGDSEKGEMSTLEQVVAHYNEGGTSFNNKDKRVRKLNLTKEEEAALVAFMKALTDSTVFTDPRFTPP
jgi:cytochrome c peroxidase